MELNTAKCPYVWDWESLVMLPSKTVEESKKFHIVDSLFEGTDGSEVGSLHSYGGRSDCGSASDLAYGSSSKSSKSAASVDSSSNREVREPPKFTLETSDCFSHAPKELTGAWPPPSVASCGSSPMAGVSAGSTDMLIGLKLGKRTYFEDFTASCNTRPSVSVCGSSNAAAMMKRSSKVSSIEIPRCQVEGCNLELSSAKDYHRKHRVCETHSKSSKVVIDGLERRFCQQCSRFHSLSEFDQKKRSCRRRLSNHNARRRKPKPEIIQFNSMRLPPALGTNLAFNNVPLVHIGRENSSSNLTWDFTGYTQEEEKMGLFEQADESRFKHTYTSSLLQSSASNMQVFHQESTTPPPSCGNITKAANQTQDDLRALSLLSTNNSWGVCSCDPPCLQHHHLEHPNHFDQSGGNGNNICSLGPGSAPLHAAPMSLPTNQFVSAAHHWQGQQSQQQLQNGSAPGLHKDVSSVNEHHQYPQSKVPDGHSFYLYRF